MSYAVGETVPATLDDYRTVGSGNWSDAANWQRYDGTSWVTAVTAPSVSANLIRIRGGHNITVNSAVTADQVIVDLNATSLHHANILQ